MSVDVEIKGCKHCNGRSIHFSYENKWYCPVGIIPEFAALQGEVVALTEWKASISSAIQAIPEFKTGQWVGDKEGWGWHFELVSFVIRERNALQKRVERLNTELEKFGKCRCQVLGGIIVIIPEHEWSTRGRLPATGLPIEVKPFCVHCGQNKAGGESES